MDGYGILWLLLSLGYSTEKGTWVRRSNLLYWILNMDMRILCMCSPNDGDCEWISRFYDWTSQELYPYHLLERELLLYAMVPLHCCSDFMQIFYGQCHWKLCIGCSWTLIESICNIALVVVYNICSGLDFMYSFDSEFNNIVSDTRTFNIRSLFGWNIHFRMQ